MSEDFRLTVDLLALPRIGESGAQDLTSGSPSIKGSAINGLRLNCVAMVSSPRPSLVGKPMDAGCTDRGLLWTLEHIPQLVVGTSITVGVILRSPHVPYFMLGMYICGYGAKGLQRALRVPRPPESDKKSYGMPSAHSTAIAFVGIYTALSTSLFDLHPFIHPASWLSGPLSLVFSPRVQMHVVAVGSAFLRALIGTGALLLAATVCWSRHHLRHHTVAQIVAGAAFGSVSACLWIVLWIYGFKSEASGCLASGCPAATE